MKKLNLPLVCLMGILSLTLSGCGVSAQDLTLTQAAATKDAIRIGQTAVAGFASKLTETAQAASPTPSPKPSDTPLPPTVTLAPTQAIAGTQVTGVTRAADQASLVGETIPDGTKMLPGTTFTKTWQLMNSGVTTWTTAYSLVYSLGDKLSAPETIPLSVSVVPGQTVSLSVDMKAPTAIGKYQGRWKLRNPSGTLFGLGSQAQDHFWVDIEVVAVMPATATSTLQTSTPTTTSVSYTATATATPTFTPEPSQTTNP